MVTKRDQPYGRSNFIVTIGGTQAGDIEDVSGLGLEIGESDYRSGSDKTSSIRKLPGTTSHTNVTLKRGMTGDLTFFDWINNVSKGNLDFRPVAITLLNEMMQPVLTVNLQNAIPVKWIGPTLSAESSERASEIIELTYEEISLQ